MSWRPTTCLLCKRPIAKGYRVVVSDTDFDAHSRERIASLHRACWVTVRDVVAKAVNG